MVNTQGNVPRRGGLMVDMIIALLIVVGLFIWAVIVQFDEEE